MVSATALKQKNPQLHLLLLHLPLSRSLVLYPFFLVWNISLLSHLSSFPPPLFLSLAVSIYLPIPLGVFPPPYNQCGF